jgi:iron complex outermembrane recepter protein
LEQLAALARTDVNGKVHFSARNYGNKQEKGVLNMKISRRLIQDAAWDWRTVPGIFILVLAVISTGYGQEKQKTPPDGQEAVELSGVEVRSTRIKEPKQTEVKGTAADGYRVSQVTVGPFGEASVKDTPLAISTVSSEFLENAMVNSTTDALKYVPTVQISTGGSQITPYFAIRGFSASTWTFNMGLDGMRSFDIYEPMEDKERIEVLSGTNSFFYGITNPAGIVNYALKRPSKEPIERVTVSNFDQQFLAHVELGGPVRPSLGDKLDYRVNLLYGNAGQTAVENQSQERYLASGALAWQLGSKTTISLDSSWSKRNLRYAQALFMPSTTTGIPSAPEINKNWGAPYTGAWDWTTRIGVGVVSQLSNAITLRGAFRFSDINRKFLLNRQVWQNKALDYKWREDSAGPYDTYVPQFNLFADMKIKTGPVNHLLAAGGGIDSYDVENNHSRSQTFATKYSSNLYGTPWYPAYALPNAGTSTKETTVYENLMLFDRATAGNHLAFTAGLSLSRVNDKTTSISAGNVSSVSKYDDHAFTPNVSVSYKPVGFVTAYYSFGKGLQTGLVVPSGYTNTGTSFAPFVSKQHEVGVKAEISRMEVNLALFHIQQANSYTVTSGADSTYYQDGSVVNQGMELGFSGRLGNSLTLGGGYSLIDASVAKSSSASLTDKAPQGVAGQLGRLSAEYMIPHLRGLSLTAGVYSTGNTWVDAANTLSIPTAITADTGFRYDAKLVGRPVIMRLNIGNFTAHNYWTTRSGILYPGSPSAVAGSITVARF